MIQSLFSKILGVRPQATWMGIIAATSSISGIIGKKSLTGERIVFDQILFKRSDYHHSRIHTIWHILDVFCNNDHHADSNDFAPWLETQN